MLFSVCSIFWQICVSWSRSRVSVMIYDVKPNICICIFVSKKRMSFVLAVRRCDLCFSKYDNNSLWLWGVNVSFLIIEFPCSFFGCFLLAFSTKSFLPIFFSVSFLVFWVFPSDFFHKKFPSYFFECFLLFFFLQKVSFVFFQCFFPLFLSVSF